MPVTTEAVVVKNAVVRVTSDRFTATSTLRVEQTEYDEDLVALWFEEEPGATVHITWQEFKQFLTECRKLVPEDA